jgi:hypothetical protein
MLNSTYGQNLMNAIAKGNSVTFPKPYIGLFKTMPGAGGTGGAEVDYPEYCRVDASAYGIEGKLIMAGAASEVITDDDGQSKTQSYVKNQEIMYFPENETGSAVTAVGVGIFTAKTGGSAYLWAEFESPVTINKNSSPMFRIDKFKWMVK